MHSQACCPGSLPAWRMATLDAGQPRIMPRIARRAGAGQVVARALRGLVEGRRHQEVFGFILGQVQDTVGEQGRGAPPAIEERVREQGGRLVGWALGAPLPAVC